MELFKGQIDPYYLLYQITYKQALALRDARLKRLIKEQKEMEEEAKAKRSKDIRDTIMLK